MPALADSSQGGNPAVHGAMLVEQAVVWIKAILLQVAICHERGRLHGALQAEQIEIDAAGLPRADPEGTGQISLAGPGFLPETLRNAGPRALSVDLETARAELTMRGIPIDPRQIDLAAVGDLVCRWICGEGADSYLRSARVKGTAPQEWRPIIERLLGCDGEASFASALDARAAIESVAGSLPSNDVQSPARRNCAAEPDTTPSIGPPARVHDTSVVGGPKVSSEPAARPSDSPPKTLGHYQILGRLGQGGMGDVYQGYEPQLGREVAIKVLPAELARHEEFVRRFRAEASAAARLIHPNIVQVFFIGEDQGLHFFAMQYVEGESLSELLDRQKCLRPEEATSLIEQCLHGLAAAHDLGMIHRDIKPGNILIDRRTRRALLADFGLVKALGAASDSRTTTGVVMGTSDYISPEQGRGKTVDARSDLYSVGVMLYRMLSGRLPFFADSPTAMIFQHVYETPPPLRQVCPDVPEHLAQIVHRLLAKSPDDRFQSAAELLKAIQSPPERSSTSASGRDRPAEQRPTIVFQSGSDSSLQISGAAVLLSEEPAGWLTRLQRGAGWAARKVAPELVQQLQTTGQQVDDAVHLHAERLEELDRLAREAESVLDGLRREAGPSRDGKQREATQQLAELIREQDSQLQEIRARRDKARVTLQTLRSQRDTLQARLKAAQAQVVIAGGKREPPRPAWRRLARRPGMLALMAAALAAGILLIFAQRRQGSPARVDVAATSPPSTERPPAAAPQGTAEEPITPDAVPAPTAAPGDAPTPATPPAEAADEESTNPVSAFDWQLAVDRAAKIKALNGVMFLLHPQANAGLFPTVPKKFLEHRMQAYAGGQGNTVKFEVETAGFAFLGCNFDYQGGADSTWTPTRWLPNQFIENGWQQLGDEAIEGKLVKKDNRAQSIFVKFLQKGEKLSFQCNKYDPPYLLLFERGGEKLVVEQPPERFQAPPLPLPGAREFLIQGVDGQTSRRASWGPLRRGQVMRIQYLSGTWCDIARAVPGSPDDAQVANENVPRLRVCGAVGTNVTFVIEAPGGTAERPFAFRAAEDYDQVFFNNGDVSPGNNLGEVKFRVWVD